MTDSVSDLQALIGGLSGASEADLLLMHMDPTLEHRIRLCAVPHTFDAEVLRVLDSSLSDEEAAAILTEFQLLPGVVQSTDGLALHDVVRAQLFRRWLLTENEQEF